MSEELPFSKLMHEVCVTHGWCGGVVDGVPLHVTDFIPSSGSISAKQFVDWVLMADGVDPLNEAERWAKQRKNLEKCFVEHMGNETVDASLLRWP